MCAVIRWAFVLTLSGIGRKSHRFRWSWHEGRDYRVGHIDIDLQQHSKKKNNNTIIVAVCLCARFQTTFSFMHASCGPIETE